MDIKENIIKFTKDDNDKIIENIKNFLISKRTNNLIDSLKHNINNELVNNLEIHNKEYRFIDLLILYHIFLKENKFTIIEKDERLIINEIGFLTKKLENLTKSNEKIIENSKNKKEKGKRKLTNNQKFLHQYLKLFNTLRTENKQPLLGISNIKDELAPIFDAYMDAKLSLHNYKEYYNIWLSPNPSKSWFEYINNKR